jgi:hypothetical protein
MLRRDEILRHIAHAFSKGSVPPDEIIPLPEGMPEKIAAAFGKRLLVRNA